MLPQLAVQRTAGLYPSVPVTIAVHKVSCPGLRVLMVQDGVTEAIVPGEWT